MMMRAVDGVLRRRRLPVAVGLAALTAAAWLYVVRSAAEMRAMQPSAAAGAMEPMAGMQMELAMPAMQAWGLSELVGLFTMWAIMMVAMMLPSASPMILLFSGVRQRQRPGADGGANAAFVFGYLLVWTAFSALAAAMQWLLHRVALLSPAMTTTSAAVGGALLVIAGIVQWTPLKQACLTECRSPLAFLIREWRDGTRGALIMGMRHGAFCVGCCWALMALLFVAGVMNLLWVAAIAGFVLLEKVLPAGAQIGRVTGVFLIAWGVTVLLRG
jgi:predicted metal-binding membrane protein